MIIGCRKQTVDQEVLNTNSINLFESKTGVYEFSSYEPLADKPFNIHFYIPDNANRESSPILFIFPGMNRNADDYLNTWIPLAESKNIMVFSFEFSDYYYTGGNAYQQGFVLDENGNLNNEDVWTFSVIEPVFDLIKSNLNYQSDSYDIYGHSGGAQFVHRFIQFKPAARINRGVAANSGWYTIPDTTIDYPYGIKGTSLTTLDIQNTFQHKLEIHLGQNDNNPDDPSLRVTPEANVQGAHRLERGRYFILKSDTMAGVYNSSMNWTKKEVPNTGHSNLQMSSFAANELY